MGRYSSITCTLSLVKKPLSAWDVYAEQPCRFIKIRSQKLIKLEQKLEQSKFDLGSNY